MLSNRKTRRRAEALARKAGNIKSTEKPVYYSANIRPHLRAALLSTAAAGAMVLAQPQSAHAGPDACVTVGTVATCQGDQSDGITSQGGGADFDEDNVSTLNVNNLTQDITPGAGVDGIQFISGNDATDDVIIISDTGPFSITTTGVQSEGIFARNANGPGNVSVTSTGNINTNGNGSEGIFARDTGVGNVTITSIGDITTLGTNSDGIEALDENAGSVTIASTGNISTDADDSDGIRARDFGNGDVSVTSIGNITTQGNNSVGIYAYDDNDNGNVDVTSTGNILTTGTNAAAIFAIDNGNGDVNVSSTGNIVTTGINAVGIYARDIDNGNIEVTSTGNITTTGNSAFGIFAEDEGNGNIDITSTGNIMTTGDNAFGIFADDDDNGNIDITSTGNIMTTGDNAFGIFAVDVGNGHIDVTSTGNIMTTGNTAVGILARDFDNGNIEVTSTGNISTTGIFAHGILALDYDNGNVVVASTGDITTTGGSASGIFAVDNGNGNVTVTSTGNISANGDYTAGIYARDDDNDVVTVTSTGDITASGTNTAGILAFTDNAGMTTVNVAGGTVQGGNGASAGVSFSPGGAIGAGATNTLNIAADATVTALSGIAIAGNLGDDTVNNAGTVTGNVFLDVGNNAFNNLASSVFNPGDTVDLGGGNLTNAGTLSPGGTGAVQTTALAGNIIQTATGTFAVDLNQGGPASDLVNASGTANVAGTVAVNIVSATALTQNTTILTAAGGTTNSGLTLGAITSPAFTAQLLFPNATDVVLSTTIDFTPAAVGLNPNQTNIGNNLNSVVGAGTGGVSPVVLALLNGVSTAADFTNALDQLSPEAFLNSETATLFAGEEFTNNLFSCKVPGSGGAFIREGQCVWVRPEGRFFERDTTTNNIGYDEDIGGVSAGAQIALAPGWSAGFGLGYEYSNLETDTGVESDSRRYSIGGALKYQTGNLLLAGAISGGNADFDTTRRITFGGLGLTPESSHDVSYFAGQLRAAYLFSQGNWYAKPLVDLNLTNVDRDGVTEAGGGAANLVVGGSEETYFSVTPAIEIGAEFQTSDANVVIQPYLKAGVTFYEDDSNALTASFAGAPAGVGGFAISSEFDDTFADIEAGLTLLHDNNTSLSFGYEGRISDNSDQHGFYGKGTAKF